MIRVIRSCSLMFLFSLIALSSNVFSQQPIQRVISSSDGLEAVVNDISFDEHGFAWFATEQGLYRATNTHLERIDLSKNGFQLQDQYFSRLESIGQNKILVDAFQGIHVFDASNNDFVPLTTLMAFKELKPARLSKVVALSSEKKLLLTTDGQVIYFSNVNRTALNIIQLPALQDDEYKDVLPLDSGNVLIASKHKLGIIDQGPKVDLAANVQINRKTSSVDDGR